MILKNKVLAFIFSLFFVFFLFFLIFYFLKQNINLFYTPTQINSIVVPINKVIKIGGFVKNNSIKTDNSLNVFFDITDYDNSISVRYNGILPDLFAENKGVIVIGYLDNNFLFNAKQVLAKHDENYTSLKNIDISNK